MAVNNNTNLNVTGLIYDNGSASFTGRTITGTSNAVDVSNGNGVSGNPTLALSSNIYVSNISFDSGTNKLGNYIDRTTWTPVITGTSTAGAGTYSVQTGYYMKIMNVITCWFNITWSAHTGTGNMTITGLPVSNGSTILSIGAIHSSSLTYPGSSVYLVGQLPVSSSTITLYGCVQGSSKANVAMDSAASVNGYISYFV